MALVACALCIDRNVVYSSCGAGQSPETGKYFFLKYYNYFVNWIFIFSKVQVQVVVNEEVVEDFAAQLDDGGGGCGCGVVSDSGAKPVPKVNGKV